MDWEVYPQGLYNLLKRFHSDYNPPALYITENGAAYNDVLTPDGKVHDERRTAYFRAHFEAAAARYRRRRAAQGLFRLEPDG